MPAFLLALALAAAQPGPSPAADSPVAPPSADAVSATAPASAQADTSAAAADLPKGAVQAGAAPSEPFQLVAWCAGAVEGYLRLKPDIFDEVKRIETTYRRPGSNLAEDLKDYADMEKDARRQMLVYQKAIQAAEKASPNDLSLTGQRAYERGLAVWAAPASSTRARVAQEWMSWALPATCETTAKGLTTRASLMGEALKPSVAALGGGEGQAEVAPSTEAEAAPAEVSPEAAGQAAAVEAAPAAKPRTKPAHKIIAKKKG